MYQNVGVALPRCLRRFRVFQYSFPSLGQVCARGSSLPHPIECTVNCSVCHLFEIIQAPCNAYSHIDFMKSHTFSLIVFHIIPNKFIYIYILPQVSLECTVRKMYSDSGVCSDAFCGTRLISMQHETKPETKHWLKPKWWIICEVQSKRTISNPLF